MTPVTQKNKKIEGAARETPEGVVESGCTELGM